MFLSFFEEDTVSRYPCDFAHLVTNSLTSSIDSKRKLGGTSMGAACKEGCDVILVYIMEIRSINDCKPPIVKSNSSI